MANDCGSCTLCCRLLGIMDLQPPKAANAWCTHCVPGRECRIYEARPTSCREFQCIWLQSQDSAKPMPDELRPDKVKVVLAEQMDGNVHAHVDPGRPDAWKTGTMGRLMEGMAAEGMTVIVSHGENPEKIVLKRSGGVVRRSRIRMSEPDENGMQWFDPADPLRKRVGA